MNPILLVNDKASDKVMIHKVVLGEPNINGIIKLELPTDSKILAFGMQNDQIVMWYEFQYRLVYALEKRVLKIVNTGVVSPEFYNNNDFRFYTTVISSNGIVWHCFAVV